MTGPDFLVLTGFLGSGKTTLLRDYLGGPAAADTAVIVNEAGEIGLDGIILRESGGDVPMAMLANGCICCQIGSSLALTVETLLAAERPVGAPPLRRIILETSGLSKPGPILRQLATLAQHRMRIAVVATYDAVRGVAAGAFEEAAAQWSAAHRVVVTKADHVPLARLDAAGREVAALNPLAERVVTADRARLVAEAFAPLTGQGALAALPSEGMASPHPRIATYLARPTHELGYDDLAAWLDNLAGALGERLLRLKGLVRVVESRHPLLVQSVGTLFAPPHPLVGPDAGRSSFLVVIVRDAALAEFDDTPPQGLFRFARWSEQSAFSRIGPPRLPKAEAV